MYNGIGLRTVRGSGTNGYVQRNISYINASRTRQTLAYNQCGGTSARYSARQSGKVRPPPNEDILRHEQKRKVELELLEISLDMEERGCDSKEIRDIVSQERERLLKRLHGVGDGGQEKAMDMESSHARQKRKEEENKRIKEAFGIASSYIAGESFDPEMQERRRLERKEKRKQEEKTKEEARQLRQRKSYERDTKTDARREEVCSELKSRSPPDCRSRGRDDTKSRKSHSRSLANERCSRPLLAAERKRRSVSFSRSSSSGRSSSRSRNRTLRKEKFCDKDSPLTKKTERSRSFSASTIHSDSSIDLNYSNEQSRGEKSAGSAILNDKHKVSTLLEDCASVSAMVNNESLVNLNMKEKKSNTSLLKNENNTKECSSMEVKRKVKHKPSFEQAVNEAQMSFPAALPVQVKKKEKIESQHFPCRSASAVLDSRLQSHKRKQSSMSPDDRRRYGRSTNSVVSRSSRHRRMHSHSASSDRSRSYSSDSSRSRSKSRFCSRSIPRRRRRSLSRSRGRDRSNFRSRRF